MKKAFFVKNRATKIVALAGALGALSVLLTVTRLGFVPWFSGTAITVLHIPVILVVCLSDTETFSALWASLAVALVFGLSSLVNAAVSPTGPIDPFFVNPFVSVLPRLLFAFCVFFMYKGFSLLNSRSCTLVDLLIIATTAFLGTIVHAFFVLGALVLASAIPSEVMWALIVSNTIVEAVAAVVLTLAVVGSFKGLSKRKLSKLNTDVAGDE